jgi:hypothetical protein
MGIDSIKMTLQLVVTFNTCILSTLGVMSIMEPVQHVTGDSKILPGEYSIFKVACSRCPALLWLLFLYSTLFPINPY